jgi:hypothetical protein
MSRLLIVPATILIAACIGCGSSNGRYPVYGKVLFKGEPAVGATVRFVPPNVPNRQAVPFLEGVVQSDGAFSMNSGQDGEGVPPGTYDVLIVWHDGPHAVTKIRGAKPETQPPDRLHGFYANPKKPYFHAEIKSETNYLTPFEITEVRLASKTR